MGSSRGKFLWYELATTDVEGAIRFYGDVVGLGTREYGGAGMRYVQWTSAGDGVGGVVPLAETARASGVPPHWAAYVMADDVDALTRRAETLGGRALVPPTDIPTVGRFSVIADPAGATIAMLDPIGPDVDEPAEVADGHVSWHELMTSDREQAFDFYAALFGWRKHHAVDTPMGPYQVWGRGERALGGMMTIPAGENVPPHWMYYWKVPDLDGAVVRVTAGGGRVIHGPHEVPGGSRVAQCFDPQGAAFALHGA